MRLAEISVAVSAVGVALAVGLGVGESVLVGTAGVSVAGSSTAGLASVGSSAAVEAAAGAQPAPINTPSRAIKDSQRRRNLMRLQFLPVQPVIFESALPLRLPGARAHSVLTSSSLPLLMPPGKPG